MLFIWQAYNSSHLSSSRILEEKKRRREGLMGNPLFRQALSAVPNTATDRRETEITNNTPDKVLILPSVNLQQIGASVAFCATLLAFTSPSSSAPGQIMNEGRLSCSIISLITSL